MDSDIDDLEEFAESVGIPGNTPNQRGLRWGALDSVGARVKVARPKPVAVCPYCRQKIGPRHEVRWTGIQAKVIDTLTEFGERGATTEELALVVYGSTEYHRKIVSLIYIMRARLEDTSWEIWHPHSHFGHYVLRRRN